MVQVAVYLEGCIGRIVAFNGSRSFIFFLAFIHLSVQFYKDFGFFEIGEGTSQLALAC